MLIGITDKQTGHTYHICGGFPSASGKTNLAMMLAPDVLGDRDATDGGPLVLVEDFDPARIDASPAIAGDTLYLRGRSAHERPRVGHQRLHLSQPQAQARVGR